MLAQPILMGGMRVKRWLRCLLAAMMIISTAAAEDNRYDALKYAGRSGYAAVQRNGLWGIVDRAGTLAIPCEWDDIEMLEDGILVCRDGLWGCIDFQGNVLLPVEWTYVHDIIQSCYAVERDGLYGLVDSQGNLVLPLERGVIGEEWIDDTSYIIRGAEVSTRQYFVLEHGIAKEVQVEHKPTLYTLPEGYETAYMTTSAGMWVKSKTEPVHYRLIDRNGRFLTENAWDDANNASCGLCLVKKEGKVGFVNDWGELVIPLVYDGAWEFTDDMALVRQGDERFWIDTQGNPLSDWGWTQGSRMRNGYATVITEYGLYGVIDRDGNHVIPCEWTGMEQWQWPFMWSEIVSMSRDGQTAFLNTQGEMVTGRLHQQEDVTALYHDDVLFLLENGVLSIWHADRTKVY